MMNPFVRQSLAQRCAVLCLSVMTLLASGVAAATQSPVASVMDELVATLCEGRSFEEVSALDNTAIMAVLTPEQRRVLSTEYWAFDVNVPVIVSVVRDTAQETPPFWLEERDFEKTGLTVCNENYTYEVWQKQFPAGRVGLGINGFDRHRPHYFVGVGPQNTADTVAISNAVPAPQEVYPFAKGSSIYHDWPDLVITEMPESLKGHLLLPTIRGRAREAQLIGVFRQTAHPSSETPDMVTLTWSDNPQTTQTIQWRVSLANDNPHAVYYRRKGTEIWAAAASESNVLDDRNIINDRSVRWHRATLCDLQPDTDYEYAIAATGESPTAAVGEFRTAPAHDGAPFTFLWMSDTHNNPAGIPLLEKAWELHPDAAFLTISGDLVGTGQQRDDWDTLFANYKKFLRHRPIVPSIGNHDAIDGLGSELYRTLLHLPDNGPEGFQRGQSYSLRYGNLLLVSLDVTADVAAQRPWLEATLRDTDAQWKVAVLHFPPYALREDYPDIQQEWCSLFDAYHVDLALAGHVHYYLRTFPLRDGEIMDNPEDGTIYLLSVAVPGRERPPIKPRYAEVVDLSGIPTCTAFIVEDNRLVMRAYDADGNVRDTFTIEKQGR